MPVWGQSEKSIAAWLKRISTERIHSPVLPPFLAQHHPPTLEASICPTKSSCSSKRFPRSDSLPSEFLHNIYIWHSCILHRNKLKPVLSWLTQNNPGICASMSYKLKYVPFGYYMHYDVIQYVWKDRHRGPHTSNHDRKWERAHTIKHDPA